MNANNGHEHQSVVSSVCFHPGESILMTSGLDRKVKLFDIKHSDDILDMSGDDKPNYNNVKSTQKSKKIQSLFIPDLPVYCAKFILDG